MPIATKKAEIADEDEPAEFRHKTIQQLQRQCLIHQIKVARAQEEAAEQMIVYYQQQYSQYIVLQDTEQE